MFTDEPPVRNARGASCCAVSCTDRLAESAFTSRDRLNYVPNKRIYGAQQGIKPTNKSKDQVWYRSQLAGWVH